jgi:DNA repair exonuclease SbcCD nuclease subunit
VRLVHLSDLHLGYRQYQRLTPNGINQREHDVAGTFRRAVDQIVALKPAPDVILVAGDVFHSSRPSNAAILHAFRQFLRLRRELPKTHIVVVAGDHDTPRTTESGSIMGLFEPIGVEVAAHGARNIRFDDLDLSVLAVPDVPGLPLPSLTPDTKSTHNVLLIHANVTDVVPQYYAELDRATTSLSRADLHLAQWSYVAIGHYHVMRMVAPNAWYSGSIDYTSLNVWFDKSEEEELGLRGKGFIEYDTETKVAKQHVVEPSREFLDLKPIIARDMTPAEVDAAIRKAVDKVKGGIDDKVVRLVVKEIPRQVSRELDHRALREYKRRALAFNVDLRRPDATKKQIAGGPTRRPSVADVVREALATRPIPSDLDRGRLVELGMKYLDDADVVPPSAQPADVADGADA